MKAFIDYYGKKNIIPVNQNIPDMRIHFQRRSALLQQLGIPYRSIEGRRFLELGPGTGQNAIFTLMCRPVQLVLVDANPESIRITAENLDQFDNDFSDIDLVQCEIEDFRPKELFDFVLCEGVLPFQNQPIQLLKKITSLVAPGGVLIVTCVDPISYFSEVLRRSLKPLLEQFAIIRNQDLLSVMVEFFRNDLDSLKGMSRRYEDWVQDVILHPYDGGQLLSVSDVVGVLRGEFNIQGASPHFYTDWRWYKQMVGSDPGFNDEALRCYQESAVAFLDYRLNPNNSVGIESDELMNLCSESYKLHFAVWNGEEDSLDLLVANVFKVIRLIEPKLPETAKSLEDWCIVVEKLKAGDWQTFREFAGFFGRGQQYLSFIKRDQLW